MDELKNIIQKNQQFWNKEVESSKKYTIPNLDLNVNLLKQFANGELMSRDESIGKINNP